jgi:ABC-type multidrug transport system fused ATPase/permease subunit
VIILKNMSKPYEMHCPITREVMINPVVAADGNSYEKSAIEDWFGRSGKSPLTGLLLASRNLTPNFTLRKLISEWSAGGRISKLPFDQLESSVIFDRVRSAFNRCEDLLHSAEGKHIIAFLGNTGCGKSTLVNLLSGKELVQNEHCYVLSNPSTF